MQSELISLNHLEYIDLYLYCKELVNPLRFDLDDCTTRAINSRYMQWHKVGLEYYEANITGKKFKVLDYKKYMHHLMLMKIGSGKN
jgi:hypothetical protein